jgi:hypothetical protein
MVVLRDHPSVEKIKEEWQRFKEWFHWFEACGIINTKTYHMPNYDELEEVFANVSSLSLGNLVG